MEKVKAVRPSDSKRDQGRPRFEAEPQERRNITLSDRLAEKAKRISATKKNISEGIRRALDAYEEE